MPYTILFVCSGNTCRSPMAEGILRDFLIDKYGDRVVVKSAGTLGIVNSPAASMAIQVCRELEVDISGHLSQGLTPELVAEADLILCMAYHHKSDVLALFPEARSKTYLLKEFAQSADTNLEVDDPIGGSYTVYKRSRDDIYEHIKAALPEIEARIEAAEKL